MPALCPHCQRVAQQHSPNCAYCGKPLEDAPDRPSGGATPPVPRRDAASAPPATPIQRLTPADEARSSLPPPGDDAAGPGFLRTGFGWMVIVLGALVVGAFIAGNVLREEEAPPPPPPQTPGENPLSLIAEGLMPDSSLLPEPPDAFEEEQKVRRASEVMAELGTWVEQYAAEYGHYPGTLGDELEALAQFAGGRAACREALAPFKNRRVEYTRTVSEGGEEERYVLRGIAGSLEIEVTVHGSRHRGGMPRHPAPLH